MGYWKKIKFNMKGATGKTVAFVSLQFTIGTSKDDYFVLEISGGKLINGANGLFFVFPAQKGGEKWYPIVNPVAIGREYFKKGETDGWKTAMSKLSNEVIEEFKKEHPDYMNEGPREADEEWK